MGLVTYNNVSIDFVIEL